jgi:uncharacterized protein (DUF1778 family)
MAAEHRTGRERIEVRAPAWLTDLLAEAAKRLGESVGTYLRAAAMEKLARDGYDVQAAAQASRLKK